MTPRQRALARHALGLPNRKNKSYRNRFYIHPHGEDFSNWEDMQMRGEAFTADILNNEDHLFCLTLKGAKIVLEGKEELDTEDFED